MPPEKDDLKEQIRDFIVTTFMYGQGSIKDDEPLFDSGIIDSMGFIKLLAFIEKSFKVSINMSEVSINGFNTVNSIENTIRAKIHRN